MPADRDTLRTLKLDLRSDDPATRDAVAQRAVIVARSALVPVLTEALLSDTLAVRERALALLEHHAGAEAVAEARRIVSSGGPAIEQRLAPVLARVLPSATDA